LPKHTFEISQNAGLILTNNSEKAGLLTVLLIMDLKVKGRK